MYNYTNTTLAILVKAKILTEDAAQTLAKKLQSEIHRSDYVDAVAMVESVSDSIKQFNAEPWLADIAHLERRVAQLEKQLAAKGEAVKVKVLHTK